jgi:tetratricopeptide (TPR) repeat protein
MRKFLSGIAYSRLSARPVFVHAMWRTGSTYIWSKFREHSQYRAYYEPLHEILIDASAQKLGTAWSDRATEVKRHPHLDASYFAEFEAFLEAGGSCFGKNLAYQRYCLEAGDSDESLRHYIADLLIFALANRQTPVLQFNRSLLRAGWLTANFNPVNLLLLRRPIDVWKSFLSFEDRYFPTVICMIVGQNQQHPFLAGLAARQGVPLFQGATFQSEYDFYHEYAVRNLEQLYPLFYEFYLLSSIGAARDADCIIDLNGISESDSTRRQTSERLRALGIGISIDDCHAPVYADLSPEDEKCLAYEETGLAQLKQNLPRELRIPRTRFEVQRETVGEYFRGILAEFLDDSEDGVRTAAAHRLSAEDRHRQGLHLFEQGCAREAASLLRDAVLEQPDADLWNDWASAQVACERPVLAELGYQRALEMGDPGGRAAANLGALLTHLQRYQEAIPLLERGLQSAKRREAAPLTSLLTVCRSQHALKEAFRIAQGE